MRFRRKHREVPGLNTTSTADISFMLLVFFLVTSSMDTDHGLARKMAPIDEQKLEQQDVNRSNVLQISIDDHDILSCEGKTVSPDELRQQVESFLASRQTDNYAIAVETGRHTSYNAYFNMQHSIVAAYHKLGIKPMKIKEGIRREE
ncbi:Biopolymer transport protein ExbD [Prevotellaceae bacterium MN60]|nr:Biopolymer transport protein ExbD [Prevotellaceae bacterium MN60]